MRLRRTATAYALALIILATDAAYFFSARLDLCPLSFTGMSLLPGSPTFKRPCRQDRGDIISSNFFNQVIEGFQEGIDPERAAVRSLAEFHTSAAEQSAEDMKLLLDVRDSARQELLTLQQAMTKLETARSNARQESSANWEEDEEKWDDSLAACAAPVLEAAESAQEALSNFELTLQKLDSAAESAKAKSVQRAAAATLLVEELPEEAQERLSSTVEEASQPLSANPKFVQSWALASAEAKDMHNELRSLKSAVASDPGELIQALREVRVAKASAEKTRMQRDRFRLELETRQKSAAAEARANAASMDALPLKDEQQRDSLLAIAVVLVAGLLVTRGGALNFNFPLHT
eukprot:TRINITY_DN777_c0_g1_i1.p1 TRINITY_DN777_c0_g1~~TRINITY_DN777_c0_g1_i1.p1  ORF type:complete len:349 (-),score=99.56 TRINITY_DN777_c0_g1_i1:60-1106(-)